LNIRVLNAQDTQVYRTIRLNALKNSPTSFGSSYEEESAFAVKRFTNRIAKPNSQTFGAFEESQLVGICNLSFQPRKKMGHRAEIFSMYVEPNFRGKGIGKALMTRAVKRALEKETIRQIYLTVVRSNQAAKTLYASFGFQTYGVDRQALQYKGEFYDFELMVLFLKKGGK